MAIRHLARFNPSQVGYKQLALRGLYFGVSGFNPSQVGYKPSSQNQSRFSPRRVSIPHR